MVELLIKESKHFMKNKIVLVVISLSCFIQFSCSKKVSPIIPAESPKKTAPVPKIKIPTPKVIAVNDNAAQKTVDGRFYYDLNGKRYWRNKRDGKYYLFNKSMYNNDDFKGN